MNRYERLKQLIEEYKRVKKMNSVDLSSEETVRVWLNRMLEIFDWDVGDTSQVTQEKILSRAEIEKLKGIDSSNTRPDYTFKIANQKLTFLDAKDITVRIKTDSSAAFQIKSYGWSIAAPCVFISNFEELAFYDSTYIPKREQDPSFGRVYLTIDEYLDNFELIENHLLKRNIYSGKLQSLYESTFLNNKDIAKITPDHAFAIFLSNFRLNLARNIISKNKEAFQENIGLLGYIVQVIINRILFVKVCEARNIEEEGLLKSMADSGNFWNLFKKSSYFDFFEHYDGPLFERKKLINSIDIDNEVFLPLIENIYYPSPYRFDVIPTKLLGDIYEIFLSKKLFINNGQIEDKLKSEYSKTLGAVSTPQYLVNDLIKRTITEDKLLKGNIKDLLDTKILDFTCGSGVFLIQAFDYLENILKKLFKSAKDPNYDKYFLECNGDIILTLEGKRLLMSSCLYGVDVDPEAVEVARVSLSLKLIETSDILDKYNEIGIYGSKILNGVGKNIKCGNSLVSDDILELFPTIIDKREELLSTNPFDWKSEDNFKDIFENKGGFDYIIGNPPYVEVKNYNVELPYLHKYIKQVYLSAKNGKVDLAIPFIEKGLGLLNSKGKLGFVVQKRFFKTDYGSKIRQIISTSKNLNSIVDFESTSIFKDRITYISLLILSKAPVSTFSYKKISSNSLSLPNDLFELDTPEKCPNIYNFLPTSATTGSVWSFDDIELIKTRDELSKLGRFKDYAKIKVGIQALWDRAYHFKPSSVSGNIIIGSSHLEKEISIEKDACRALICNENFYPFRTDKANEYVIFPYDVSQTGEVTQICFSDFKSRFPKAGGYLERNKDTIIENIETIKSEERWHLYTRVQNHGAIFPKILTPMTSLDTYAMVSKTGRVYCDNANVYFVDLENRCEDNLYATSAVINSTIFSVLARSIANPQSKGYFKFNKQFLEPIPFPVARFQTNDSQVAALAQIARMIESNQQFYESASTHQKQALVAPLNMLWKQLDNLVYQLYGLNTTLINFFESRGRNKPRV